jgi:amidase
MQRTSTWIISLFCLVTLSACQPTATESSNEPPASEAGTQTQPAIDLVALTAPVLQQKLASGELTATEVTAAYLERIAGIDDAGPELNAIIEINPDAVAIAQELDRQFQTSGVTGPLHGIPVVLKANIDTNDAMATTAGSLALADHHATVDAFHVAQLRNAGAVILAKTNLSEWANFRDQASSSGWSSIGGQTKNPHVLDRNPCGSSSGSGAAVAASLSPLAVGTETNGSIVCPAGVNGIVGIKPTVGTVSRSGIIPIAHSQDTAGPMAKTVTGAALMLESMVAYDEADPGASRHPAPAVFQPDPDMLRLDGKRIGIYRSYYGVGTFPEVDAIFEAATATLASLGATLIDPIEYSPPEDDQGNAQYDVLLYEFKADLNAYLASHQVDASRDTLTELIAWNDANAESAMPIFGQSIFLDAEAKGGLDDPEYQAALTANNEALRDVVDALLEENQLDALFIPVNGPAWKTDWIQGDRYSFGGTASLAAITGYPSIVLPGGNVRGLPIAVGFVGEAFSEARLIQMAYAFEQATRARIDPGFVPTLETP